ncbi:4a-hydroxytetrahydrobiopterin dehydratase [Oscillatoria sp. FACHB-1407]|uniref:4a-hydroxytetrahydrobiopterin dehydratase n=1 Tax=Oscillatoria sp. FACHB-1407 TaxID=2692847 RepID=UPI0016828C00|nr:4a-hydroxytetrahydrobiopterin dehydratase [Oscillatoria sp. FACHB-1407]MBD2465814.1 4a-hydroxytetrahydrobiopterin dehydratase [Oscillatoria sp. FACHB-1407]
MAQLLSDTDVQERLTQLPDWTLQGKEIQSVRKFKDFVEAIAFVNRLVEPAEAANHHPDITISYNRVSIALTTHDAGGLTENDFALAKAIDQLA